MTFLANLAFVVKWHFYRTLARAPTVHAIDFGQNQGLKLVPDGITFDPLGVAAILHNPRAEGSAARLYSTTKRDQRLFRWPHTAMFGGALIPLKTLVDHMASNMTSLHPAVVLCMKDTVTVAVTMSNEQFKELPFTFSHVWLRDAVAFQASAMHPQNDITIVYLDKCDSPLQELPLASRILKSIIDGTGFLTGAMLIGSMVCSILFSEIWGTILFFLYALHWLASTLIAYSQIVTYETPNVGGQHKSQCVYAVHEREGGGIVVFKAIPLVFEQLARSRWIFKHTPWNHFLHWFWMVSGALAAFSSVACMVNMRATFQLAFLGVLSYSSVAEIWITQCARSAQLHAVAQIKGEFPRPEYIPGKAKRAHTMIHASLAIRREEYQLRDLDWIKLKKLPPDFQPLQTLIDTLQDISPPSAATEKGKRPLAGIDGRPQAYQDAVQTFQRTFPAKYQGLVDDILKEVGLAWDYRHGLVAQESEESLKIIA